jgi:Mg/Co/Ni transporter MgtE
VIDWAAIQPFGDVAAGQSEVRLRTSHEGLQRLRPGELADLLEDLRRPERQRFLATLDLAEAADALEEMDPEELTALLSDAEPETAAGLLTVMEPDEAVDALRQLSTEDRRYLLSLMPTVSAAPLLEILGYPEDRAGGFMTTTLVLATPNDSIADVVDRLSAAKEHDTDIDSVAVVDNDGQLVGDVSLLDLLLALRDDPGGRVASELDEEGLVTVEPDAGVDEVAERLVEARRLSLLVTLEGRPIGRILADDVLDALLPAKGRLHFPRLLQ